MSKEVNNKINVSRELLRKQIFDVIILFAIFCIIFYFVKFLDFTGYDLIIVLVISFIVLYGLFEFSRKAVKKSLDIVISSTLEKTAQDMEEIQGKNNFQKENNSIYTNKIDKIRNLIDNLQKYSQNMSDLTSETQEKTNQSLNFTNNEYGAVKTNIEKMFSIRHKIQTIAELILELSEKIINYLEKNEQIYKNNEDEYIIVIFAKDKKQAQNRFNHIINFLGHISLNSLKPEFAIGASNCVVSGNFDISKAQKLARSALELTSKEEKVVIQDE